MYQQELSASAGQTNEGNPVAGITWPQEEQSSPPENTEINNTNILPNKETINISSSPHSKYKEGFVF